VVDSRTTSGGLGFLVTYAAQLIEANRPIEEIIKEIQLKIPKINLFVYVDNFDSMIRSGRISKIGGRLAQFAHVKPIIKLNSIGKGVMFDKAFSETKALTKLINHVNDLRATDELDKYGLVHAGVPDKTAQLARLTTEAFGQEPAFICLWSGTCVY